MDYNDLLKVKKKKQNGEKLTLEEVRSLKIWRLKTKKKLLLNWNKFTDYPKPRGNITIFKSEEQLNEILIKGKPVWYWIFHFF